MIRTINALEDNFSYIADAVDAYAGSKIAIYPYGKWGKVARLVLEINNYEHIVMIDEKLHKQEGGYQFKGVCECNRI